MRNCRYWCMPVMMAHTMAFVAVSFIVELSMYSHTQLVSGHYSIVLWDTLHNEGIGRRGLLIDCKFFWQMQRANKTFLVQIPTLQWGVSNNRHTMGQYHQKAFALWIDQTLHIDANIHTTHLIGFFFWGGGGGSNLFVSISSKIKHWLLWESHRGQIFQTIMTWFY